MSDSILTTQQVADLFAVHATTVIQWANDGRLPHFRTPGGHRRYVKSDVLALRDATTVAPADVA